MNTHYVQAFYKVHKAKELDDICKQVSCHFLYLQETIPLVFHLCLLTAEKDKQILDLIRLLTP